MTTNNWEEKFDKEFKGWILQDDQEVYRSFDKIKDFIRQEIEAAEQRGYEMGWEGREKVHETLPTFTPKEADDFWKKGIVAGKKEAIEEILKMKQDFGETRRDKVFAIDVEDIKSYQSKEGLI